MNIEQWIPCIINKNTFAACTFFHCTFNEGVFHLKGIRLSL